MQSHVTEEGAGSSQHRVSKANLLKALSDRHQHVEWTGEVFRVKPMKLYRLNLSQFRSRSNIAVANLQIHR